MNEQNPSGDRLRRLIACALFAALTAVLTLVTVPLPSGIPITLQTFAVALCGYVLGSKWGVLSVAVYEALGAAGLPVFSGLSGGVGKLLGVTGGYLWGFLPMAACCGILLKKKNPVVSLLFGLLGLGVCHLCGAVQFSLVSGNGPLESFLTASVPYLPKDVICVAAAYFVSLALRRVLKKIRLPLAI